MGEPLPGRTVDVGSHQYCFSFEPADHWSEYYCQQPELRAYFDAIVDKYGLRSHCRFGTAVTEADVGRGSSSVALHVSGPRTAPKRISMHDS